MAWVRHTVRCAHRYAHQRTEFQNLPHYYVNCRWKLNNSDGGSRVFLRALDTFCILAFKARLINHIVNYLYLN